MSAESTNNPINESAGTTEAATSPESNSSAAPKTELELAQELIASLEAKVKDESNKYLYLYADFENYKKRMIKERSDTIKFGWENVARELLGVLDNLDRAIQFMPPTTDKNLKTGIEMVASQFIATLTKQGVAEINTKENFNPELHEAVGQEPSSLPQGQITQAMVKGYTLHGRLLRPAKVVVSTGLAAVKEGVKPSENN